jgi:hypothetical protein
MTQAANTSIFSPPTWTTTSRPCSPVVGQLGLNTQASIMEVYTSGGWSQIGVSQFGNAQLAIYLTSNISANANITTNTVGIGTTNPQASLDMSAKTDALILPGGTTAQRSGNVNGAMRYNSTTNTLEAYVNGGWVTVSLGATNAYTVNYLIVAGGGSGGAGTGGGGGAGGLLAATAPVIPGVAYTATVGGGAPASVFGGTATSGGANSSFIGGSGPTAVSLTAIGGGQGGGYGPGTVGGGNGGSGGGGFNYSPNVTPAGPGNTSAPGQGNNGGVVGAGNAGAGGGGAGVPGCATAPSTGGNGGNGRQFCQYAPNYGYPGGWFAGGGGGSGGTNQGIGGLGGGGSGGNPGTSAIVNTGGGGGGNWSYTTGQSGGGGGSGIIIVSYANPVQKATGGTVTSYNPGGGTVWVHAFTGTGTYTA